jgi:DNA ligase (NAD+)
MNPRIKVLSKKISKAQNDYYNGNPSASDKSYDAWMNELKGLDPNHPLITKIGAMPISEWEKVEHEVPMASLNKVNTIDEFNQWVIKDCNNIEEYLLTEKLDGISVSIKYSNGQFEQALTRGNGTIGENISSNVIKMKGVLETLSDNFSGHIRGEIVLLKSDHKKYFSEYANPRNAASGIARRYDGDGSEHLTVLFYNVDGKNFNTELECFEYLTNLNLKTPNYKLINKNDVSNIYSDYHNSLRESLDYDIDGLVITVNDSVKNFALGNKGRGPAGSMALKFDAAASETIIRDIIWQVGNTGMITPVASFDEVDLAGVKVKRASLYNYSYICELNINIGAKALVIRANDVIPRVEEILESTGTIDIIKNCPSCGTEVIRNGEYITCPNNKTCPQQVLGRISIWIKELGILEWGDKVIQKMIDSGLVKDVSDIYKLTQEQIASLDNMGDRSAKLLLKELDKYREITLYNLIGGLGIRNISTSTVKLVIGAGYNTLDKIESISLSQLESIPGFGSIRAEAFYNGLINNKDRIQDILKAGVTIKERSEGALSGKSFCFSGASSLPRKALIKITEDNGGEVKKSVGKDLHYLVVSDINLKTSKTEAAKKNKTAVISEEQFINMTKGN